MLIKYVFFTHRSIYMTHAWKGNNAKIGDDAREINRRTWVFRTQKKGRPNMFATILTFSTDQYLQSVRSNKHTTEAQRKLYAFVLLVGKFSLKFNFLTFDLTKNQSTSSKQFRRILAIILSGMQINKHISNWVSTLNYRFDPEHLRAINMNMKMSNLKLCR